MIIIHAIAREVCARGPRDLDKVERIRGVAVVVVNFVNENDWPIDRRRSGACNGERDAGRKQKQLYPGACQWESRVSFHAFSSNPNSREEPRRQRNYPHPNAHLSGYWVGFLPIQQSMSMTIW